MKPKTFATIAAATAVMVVAAVVSVNRDVGYTPPAGTGELVFPGLLEKANDVAKVTVQHTDGIITIVGGADGWRVEESDGYAARAPKLKRAILGLAQLRLLEAKTRRPGKYDKLELRDLEIDGSDAKRIKLYDKAGTELADLLVGRPRIQLPGTTTGGVYVRRPGDAQAWLAAGNPDLSDEKRDWLERKIVDIDAGRVARVVVSHANGETFTVSKATPEAKDFTLENIPEGKRLISQGGPNAIGQALAELLLDDARRNTASFDEAKAATAVFTTFDGLRITCRVAKGADGKDWLRIAAEAVADAPEPTEGEKPAVKRAQEITARTAGWTYRISEYAASNIAKRLEFLIEDAKPKS